MQEIPLSLARILEYGRTTHSESTIKTAYSGKKAHSGISGNDIHRSKSNLIIESLTFKDIGTRACAFAHVLDKKLGITADQRVATFLYNSSEHMEIFFAAACKGAIFHPLNMQLSDDQLIHIINHAHDEVIICDPRLSIQLARIIRYCPCVRTVIFINGPMRQAFFPPLVEILFYEELLDNQPATYDWPTLPEDTAAVLCYSTGTTGAPKGVLYSHRSLYLHSLNLRTTDSFALAEGIPFLCCVPIYHVLSWGVPLAAFMSGTPLIFYAHDFDAPDIAELIATTHPRMAHGAPTLWTQLLIHYDNHPPERMSLTEIFSGGSPVPPTLIRLWEQRYGVDIIHVWGMTETSPIGTVARPPSGSHGNKRWQYRISQGRFPAGMEYKVLSDGKEVTGSDRYEGEILVRGPWVTGSYFRSTTVDSFRDEPLEYAEDKFSADGWLRTGDVGSVSDDGFLSVEDRIRDVIRSGGEWIYSVQLENIIMSDEKVVECAVIGYPDEQWGERPLAVTVLREGVEPTKDTAYALARGLKDYLPQWMIPEYWTFVKKIDKTSVDKFDKVDLRKYLHSQVFDIIHLESLA